MTWKKTGKAFSTKDFDISYDPSPVKAEGDYTAAIRPKKDGGNFAGSTTALIRITSKDRLLSNARVSFDRKYYAYTGKPVITSYTLKIGSKELKEGIDYRRVNLTGNTEPGKATVIFEAVSGNAAGYAGSKTASYKISGKIELKDGSPFEYSYEETVPFAKGGAKPAVTVKYDGVALKEDTDFTVSFSKNKAVTNGATAVINIKGKGNYKGMVTKKFAITKQSLSALRGNIIVADQFTTRSRLKKPSIVITDPDGTKLKAGTDYTAGEPDASGAGNTEESGEVFIILKGKGGYRDDDPVRVSFRYMKPDSNLAKTKAFAIKDQTYTGGTIILGRADLKEILYKGQKTSPEYLAFKTDFTVEGYSDNVKKGKAKVTLKGAGAFAGRKTLTFKIVQRQVDYRGALIGERWTR